MFDKEFMKDVWEDNKVFFVCVGIIAVFFICILGYAIFGVEPQTESLSDTGIKPLVEAIWCGKNC